MEMLNIIQLESAAAELYFDAIAHCADVTQLAATMAKHLPHHPEEIADLPTLRGATFSSTSLLVRNYFFTSLLPHIVARAREVERHFPGGIRLLHAPGIFECTRVQAACLLANMFLGVFPPQGRAIYSNSGISSGGDGCCDTSSIQIRIQPSAPAAVESAAAACAVPDVNAPAAHAMDLEFNVCTFTHLFAAPDYGGRNVAKLQMVLHFWERLLAGEENCHRQVAAASQPAGRGNMASKSTTAAAGSDAGPSPDTTMSSSAFVYPPGSLYIQRVMTPPVVTSSSTSTGRGQSATRIGTAAREQAHPTVSPPTDSFPSTLARCPLPVLPPSLAFPPTSFIEDAPRNCLQVDFANEYIGGGTLGNGAVQEEIR